MAVTPDWSATSPTAPVIELHTVSKAFGHVQALSDLSMTVHAGEVVGVVGDNGAGKSTMLKLVSGLFAPDSGQVLVGGLPVQLDSPADAQANGIATVYQDLALVECLDVASNLCLADLPRRKLLLDRQRMEQDATKLLTDLRINISSVNTPVGLLSGGQRQIIAIARAVRLDSVAVLLDEPTAALGVRETRHVAEIIHELRQLNKAVVCISHDMEFVLGVADKIAVMRLGRCVARRYATAVNRDELIGLITGTVRGEAA
jgi:ABC-type sugar transport system ATPase subunit